MTRRSLFAALAVPFIAKAIPKPSFIDTVHDGINPDWRYVVAGGVIYEKLMYSSTAITASSPYWHGVPPYVILNVPQPYPWEKS